METNSNNPDIKFRYMMLSRLKGDCEYFLVTYKLYFKNL